MMTEVRRYTIMGSMGVAVRQGLNTPVLVSGTELILASDYDALAARVQAVEQERDITNDAYEELKIGLSADLADLRQQLAAMTAEREEAIDETASLRASCHAFDLQVQEFQARVNELEAQYAHELEEVNRQKRLDLASECDRLRNIIRGLQATLAEREERIRQLEIANKYFAISEEGLAKERDTARQDAARLRKALATLLNRYISLVDSGDAGSWDPLTEPQVGEAIDALRETGALKGA